MTTPGASAIAAVPVLPAKIGKYEVIERIGRGSMGVVYRARDEVLGRTVAVKVMASDLEDDPETRARFAREAQVGGQLLHRNITTVFDLGEVQSRLFIVMELLRGQALGPFLARPESVSVDTKLDLMLQLCDGLGAAHELGIVHRDVKPSNLWVTPDGTLKILDFGIARLASSTMTASGMIVGTPDYMSPEQAMGRTVDARSDVFSTGAVLYFMLTGRKPFASPDLPALLRRVQHEDPPPITPEEAPPPLARAVFRMLAKHPDQRPQSAREASALLLGVRRELESGTQKQTAEAAALYRDVEALQNEYEDTARALAMPGAAGEDPLLPALRDEYPILLDMGAQGLLRIPFRREDAVSVVSRLSDRKAALESQLASLRAARQSVREAEQQLAAGNARSAVVLLGSAQFHAPCSGTVTELLVRAREGAAQETLEQERQAGLALLASERAAAMAAIQEDRFDAADSHAERALTAARGAGSEAALGQVDALRLSIARSRRIAARTAEADALFRDGRRAEAMEFLRAFAQPDQDEPRLESAIGRLDAEDRRLAEIEARLAKAAEHLVAADRAWAAGDAASARDEAAAAWALDSSLDRAIEIQVDARGQLGYAAAVEARLVKARAQLADGRRSLSEGRWGNAADRAASAAIVDDLQEEAGALLVEALTREAENRIKLRRTQGDRARAQAFENGLADAQSALRSADWRRAEEAVEALLALDPRHQEAKALLRQAIRREPLPSLENAAANRGTGETTDDDASESTVRVARPRKRGWVSAVSTARAALASLVSRIRARKGQTTTEWTMIASVLTSVAVLFLSVAFPALRALVRWIGIAVRTVAP